MNLKDFKYSEQDEKRDYFRSAKIGKKFKFAIEYLLNHLPINEIGKENKINFDKIKFKEGKNYNWFFLNKKNLTILVRKYGSHFTFYSLLQGKYERKLSVFTICDNSELMNDETSDSFCDDNYKSIKKYFPKLVEMIENNKVHSLWNSISFPVEDYTEVKIASIGDESIHSLDVLMFAADELLNTYICTYAENDVLEQIKKYKVGDMFGDAYKITKVKTELKDGYYHSCGLSLHNTNFPDSKGSWSDIYSLAQFYCDQLNHDEIVAKREVMEFIKANHSEILSQIPSVKEQPYIFMNLDHIYTDIAYKMFKENGSEMKSEYFYKAIPKSYQNFIRYSYELAQ